MGLKNKKNETERGPMLSVEQEWLRIESESCEIKTVKVTRADVGYAALSTNFDMLLTEAKARQPQRLTEYGPTPASRMLQP